MGAFSSQPQPPCSCDLALVIFSSKQLEALLEAKFEATGKGLHEKITSASGLSDALKRKLRRIATIRNKLVHEPGFDTIPDRDRFIRDFNEAKGELTEIVRTRGIDTRDTLCQIQ